MSIKNSSFWGGGGFWVLGGGGGSADLGSADFIFMGARIFLTCKWGDLHGGYALFSVTSK